MEEIKAPKKERKFLKAIGKIAKTLGEELVMGIGRKFIGKVVDKVKIGKRERLSLLFLLSLSLSFASIDSIPYPITGNKQRLGFNTTGNGLVWRGLASDTVTKPTSYADKNVKAYLVLDSITGALFFWKQNKWATAMPFDSITFNTAKDGTVGIGEVEYNDSYGSLIQGLKGGNVTNIVGQQLHQRVTNNTGSVLSKGTAVYLSGSQGNRITVAKALATSDPTSANTFGIVAESIADNASGYIITEGLIMGINTSGLVEDSAVYLSPTVAGGLTSTKPQAPNHNVYIGVCVKSNAGSGELFVKIKNGLELDELHDVLITSPVTNASLYYNGGLWRDTTAALLVSDTATMLANYATKAYADTSGRFYARQDFTNVSSSTLTWTQSDTLVTGGVNVVQVYRNGQILLPTQYTIPTNASVIIGATAYKVGENYTVIFPRGGGAGSGGGSGSLTSISGGTGITVSPNPITTTGTVSADLSVLMELTDTSLLNLNTRFASKLNAADTASLSNRINAKGTVSSVATGYGLSGGTITTTGTLVLDSATVFTRIRDSIVDVAIGNDTIKILKQEYPAQSSAILNWTVTSKFPIQLKAYILVFRNGQLLNNNQYNITDTAQITLVSTSFKSGANYTVATVSGIGSVGTGVYPNPVYPEAGIAVSTGTTWTTSIVNNSSNWNTAFTDRLKWDGGSTGLVASTGRTSLGGTTIGQSMFTLANPSSVTFPQFNSDNTVTALSANSFRSAIGAGVGSVTSVTVSSTSGNPLSISNTTSTPVIELLSATSARNGYLTSTDWTTFNNKQNAIGYTPANSSTTISTTAPLSGGGDLSSNKTLSIAQASTNTNGYLTSTDWNTFNGKQNALTNPITGTGTTNYLSLFNGSTTLTNSSIQESSGNIGIGVTPVSSLQLAAAKSIQLRSGSSGYAKLMFSETGVQSENDIEFGGTLQYNGVNDRLELLTRDNLEGANLTNLGISLARTTGNVTIHKPTTMSSTLSVTGDITEGGNNVLTSADTSSMLTNYLRSGVAATTYQTILTNPITGSGVSGHIPRFLTSTTLDSSSIYSNNGKIGVGIDASTSSTHLTSKFVVRDNGNNFKFDGLSTTSGYTTTLSHDNTGLKIGHSSNIRDIRFTLNGTSGLTIANNENSPARAVGIGNDSPSHQLDVNGTFRATGAATFSSTLAVTGAITENGVDVIKGTGTASYIPKFTSSDGIGNSSILDNSGTIIFDSSIVVNDALTVAGATYYSGYQKETGTSLGDFDVIAAGTSIYIFEQTSAGSGTTTKEFLGSAASNTGRVITIANISDNAWDMAFTSIKPYTKTSTTINQVSSGQSITILSDGSKWWVISRNF